MNPALALPGVEGLAGLFDLGQVAFNRGPHAAKRLAQAKAKIGQAVIHAGRDHRMDGADQQAVTFHLAQGLGQHFLADGGDMVITNLLGPIRLTAALLPQLRAQAQAAVLNVSSGLAFVPLAMTPTYSATKAALHSWSQSLRHQLRHTSVQVIEVAPPAVGTDLMPTSRSNPGAMGLEDYITETMALLAANPDTPEILGERVKRLRQADSSGVYGEVFAMINPSA